MIRTEGACTERDYKGYVIRHLHGTLTYRVFNADRELVGITSDLKGAKKLVNLLEGA